MMITSRVLRNNIHRKEEETKRQAYLTEGCETIPFQQEENSQFHPVEPSKCIFVTDQEAAAHVASRETH